MLTDQNHRRFSIDKNSCVVDKAFPNHHRRKYKYYGDPNDSDSDIRRTLLWQGIRRLLPKLIVGSKASTIRHHFGYMLLAALEASQLNTLDPLVAIQHPFNGKLRKKEGMKDYSSISLFIRDVERLLRELYGDLDRTEFGMALYAVRSIVVTFMRFVRPDLAAEYGHAESIDYRVGIGRPEGYGISSSQHGAASMAAMVLAVRTLQVASNPTANCFYTMKFVKALNKYWPKLGGFDRGAEEICYRSCDFR
jgi:hypothetical protein